MNTAKQVFRIAAAILCLLLAACASVVRTPLPEDLHQSWANSSMCPFLIVVQQSVAEIPLTWFCVDARTARDSV